MNSQQLTLWHSPIQDEGFFQGFLRRAARIGLMATIRQKLDFYALSISLLLAAGVQITKL